MTWKLHHGDCLDLLPSIGRVQHIITDPPYEAEAHTKGRRLLGTQTNGKRTVEYGALDFDCISSEERTIAARLMVAASSGWLLVFCQAEAVAAWRDAIVQGGGRYMRAMVWIKPDGAPQFTGDRPGMGYESIVAAWCGEGRSKWNGGGAPWRFSPCPARQQQPEGAHDAEAARVDARAGGAVHESRRHDRRPVCRKWHNWGRRCGTWPQLHRNREDGRSRGDGQKPDSGRGLAGSTFRGGSS